MSDSISQTVIEGHKIEWRENDLEITFVVETENVGKWAIIDSIKQVLSFWKLVDHCYVFRRKPFDTIIIEIKRVGVFNDYSTSKDTSSKSNKERMREIMDKVNEMVATDPDILQRKEELIRELAITQEDLDKVISIIKHRKRLVE